jgi:hypothetical protein
VRIRGRAVAFESTPEFTLGVVPVDALVSVLAVVLALVPVLAVVVVLLPVSASSTALAAESFLAISGLGAGMTCRLRRAHRHRLSGVEF